MRPWIAVAAAAASVTGLVPVMHHRATASDASRRSVASASGPAVAAAGSASPTLATPSDPLGRAVSPTTPESLHATAGPSSSARAPSALPPLAGIDLTKITLQEDGATAAAPLGRVARLTLNPHLQRATQRILREFALPEAAVVVLDLSEGKVLVWASHVQRGPARDLCVESTAPAASVFKIVTAAALVETAGVPPDVR